MGGKKMAQTKYNYMAFIVDVKTGKVKKAYGAILNKGDYTLGKEAYDVPVTKKIPVDLDTNATTVETFYAKTSPGCRYVKVGGSWKRICK
jgi:hypothetical protein